MRTLIYSLLFIVQGTIAQEITKAVLGASGQPVSGASIQINYTMGEPIVGTIGKSQEWQQGFWSGSLQVIPINETQSLNGLMVYPNPVQSEINISTGGLPVFGAAIFAMDHRKIMDTALPKNQSLHQMNLETLSKGFYVLQVYVEGTEPHLFKVIKK
ncbi:T9SS type A sorting domain-containing protein [Maribacter algicola]|nr:T9SS type A sorting domain-containing protein [Maribacter algicola]